MNLAARIDHTLLKAEATGRDVHRITAEALEHGFASVCVNGAFVKGVTQALSGSPVRTCAVVGFPLGASLASVKAHEAQRAVDDGADEIDVVAFLRNLVQRDLAATKNDLAAVVRAARSKRSDVVVKVIIESAVLLGIDDESVAEQRIETACRAARESGCDFVKTSTGFHPAGGASTRAVALMKKHANGLRIKASGGIRTRDDAIAMIDAGADRLGCSSSVAIVTT